MRAAEIVERDVQADGRQVAIDLFGKAVGEPGKPLRSHAQRQILTVPHSWSKYAPVHPLRPRALRLLPDAGE